MDIQVNYVAIIAAAIISMILGFLWYSPILFAKPWMSLMGYTGERMKEAQKGMLKLYGVSFIVTCISAYILYHVMVMSTNYFGYGAMQTAITSAISMWLGFIMPVQLTDVLFGSKKLQLFLINTGYQLASLLAMGITIALVSLRGL